MDGQTKISKADNSEIIKPKGKDVTIFRNNAADGEGEYFGKLPTGIVEKIGAGAPAISISLCRNVAQDIKTPNSKLVKWNLALFKRQIADDIGGANPEEITIEHDGVYEISVSVAVRSTQVPEVP